jgi:inosine-uridine nucleoside N-ribohydrolase
MKIPAMARIRLSLILLCFFGIVTAHPWKPANYVIIDTDGGFDDMRTLCMFLASPNVRVLAITCSNGVIDAKQSYMKTKGLLRDLYHEGILVGMDDNASAKSQNCKPALNFQWGRTDSIINPVPDAVSVVDYVLANTQDPITFISLGSLITAGDCSKHCALFKKRVKSILWTSDSIMDKNNFNYNASPGSYNYIVNESGIPLQVVYGNTHFQTYTASFIQKADTIDNVFSAKALSGLNQPSPYALKFFDEIR